MAEEPLDHVERSRVAQVMQPEIGQACSASDAVPRIEQLGERMAAEREGKMCSLPGTRGTDRSRAMAAPLSAIVRGLPDFDSGTSNVRRCQSTCSHFAWVISLRLAPVSNSSLIAWAATRLSSSSIAVMSRLVSSAVRKRADGPQGPC
jgi:hypothetical protein